MERSASVVELKSKLLLEVRRFYRRDESLWKKPIVQTLRELEKTNAQAVFFGGTLRSLLASRVFHKRRGRPRDVDIVVSGISIEELREQFEAIVARQTRFGGLQLRRRGWQFDVWPLGQTWAFVQDAVSAPSFEALPSTTFFNLEAIAVEVWGRSGRPRQVFSGDDQFFQGMLTRTLEINREENPYPQLCVLRGLIMAADLDFEIGPRLAQYIVRHGRDLTAAELEELQREHYGRQRAPASSLIEWIEWIAWKQRSEANHIGRLPTAQLNLWPDSDGLIRVHSISS